MLKAFPLLLVAIVVYNALIFGGAAATGVDANAFLARSVSFTMFSDDVWRFTLGDSIVLLTLCLLFVEVVKSTRTTTSDPTFTGSRTRVAKLSFFTTTR